jgi:hypothetical protein
MLAVGLAGIYLGLLEGRPAVQVHGQSGLCADRVFLFEDLDLGLASDLEAVRGHATDDHNLEEDERKA